MIFVNLFFIFFSGGFAYLMYKVKDDKVTWHVHMHLGAMALNIFAFGIGVMSI